MAVMMVETDIITSIERGASTRSSKPEASTMTINHHPLMISQ